jgi:hypothetical protein
MQSTILWRSARKHLTPQQEAVAGHHFARLAKRWERKLDSARRARLWANARCLALPPERLDSAWGARLRRQRGAKAAHAVIRAEGRTQGEEGRAAIAANREARKRDREEASAGGFGRTDIDGLDQPFHVRETLDARHSQNRADPEIVISTPDYHGLPGQKGVGIVPSTASLGSENGVCPFERISIE